MRIVVSLKDFRILAFSLKNCEKQEAKQVTTDPLCLPWRISIRNWAFIAFRSNLDVLWKDSFFSICSLLRATDIGCSFQMINTIVHHAFPTRLELLFAFEFSGGHTGKGGSISELYIVRFKQQKGKFCESQQIQMTVLQGKTKSVATVTGRLMIGRHVWSIRRQNCFEPRCPIRILDSRAGEGLFQSFVKNLNSYNMPWHQGARCSMPECFVVPKSLTDADVSEAVPQFLDYRCPVSLWYKTRLWHTKSAFVTKFDSNISFALLDGNHFRVKCFVSDLVLQFQKWSSTVQNVVPSPGNNTSLCGKEVCFPASFEARTNLETQLVLVSEAHCVPGVCLQNDGRNAVNTSAIHTPSHLRFGQDSASTERNTSELRKAARTVHAG